MAAGYSVAVCKQLERASRRADVRWPVRVVRYDARDELRYQVRQVGSKATVQVRLRIGRFVGGRVAGQVCQVKRRGLEAGCRIRF